MATKGTKDAKTGAKPDKRRKPGLRTEPLRVKSTDVEIEDLPELDPRHALFVDAYFEFNFNETAAARSLGYKNPMEGSRLVRRENIRKHIIHRLSKMGMDKEEVKARIIAYAKGSLEDFLYFPEVERPVMARLPLSHKAEDLRAKIANAQAVRERDDLLPDHVAELSARIRRWEWDLRQTEVDAALDPDATYEVQVGTETYIDPEPVFDFKKAEEWRKLGLVKKLKRTDKGIEFELHDPLRALEMMGKIHGLFIDRTQLEGEGGGPVKLYANVDFSKVAGKE